MRLGHILGCGEAELFLFSLTLFSLTSCQGRQMTEVKDDMQVGAGIHIFGRF